MDNPVAQHHRISIQRLNHQPPDPTTRTPTGKAGQTSGSVMPTNSTESRSTAQPATTGSIGGIRLSQAGPAFIPTLDCAIKRR